MEGRARAWRDRGGASWRGVFTRDGRHVGCGVYPTRSEAVAAARRAAKDPTFVPVVRGEQDESGMDPDNLIASTAPPTPLSDGVRALALAMIEHARQDIRRTRGRRDAESAVARVSALAWVRGEIGWGVTSFAGACATLSLEIEATRRYVLRAGVVGGEDGEAADRTRDGVRRVA